MRRRHAALVATLLILMPQRGLRAAAQPVRGPTAVAPQRAAQHTPLLPLPPFSVRAPRAALGHRGLPSPNQDPTTRRWPATAAWFLAGAAGAFVAHELGHVAANLVAGNVPHLVGLRGFGFVPFFAINPGLGCRPGGGCTRANGQNFAAGRRGALTIAAAGFEVQHFANEIILSRTPDLRLRRAPMQKGWLLFNVALSAGYVAASLAHVEDPHGDAGGVAYYARVPRGVVAATLLVPALIDSWRYFRPQDAWAPWAARVGKLGLIGLTLRV